MSKPVTLVLPTYESNRLVGLELELDAGNTRLALPESTPAGWSQKSDGSLHNGYEYVLEPAIKLRNVLPIIQAFDKAFNDAHTNVGTRGGYHVHVQSDDLTVDDAYSLVKLYTHFQPIINHLVGPSRRNNSYCPPYANGVTREQVIQKFRLNTSASNRYDAKCSRSYSVINLAMMRCTDPAERSVEFRQGSPSKRTENIFGWACFVVALTDIAKNAVYVEHTMETPPTLARLVNCVKDFEANSRGISGVAGWIEWRHDYMNAKPTDEQVAKAVELAATRPIGIYGIARALDINNVLAKAIVTEAVSRRLLRETTVGDQKRFASDYSARAPRDLQVMDDLGSILR